MTPLEIFRTWFEDQVNEVREKIACEVGCALPQNASDKVCELFLSDPQKNFHIWLDKTPNGPWQQIGQVLMVREMVSMLVFRNASTREDFERKDEGLDHAKAVAEKAGYFDVAARFAAAHYTEDHVQIWINAAESWKRFGSRLVCDEAVESWFEEASPGAGQWD